VSYNQWIGFSWFRSDADYPHIAEFLDHVMRGGGDWRAGVVGGIIGGAAGIVGGAIGVLLGALQLPAWTIAFPIVVWTAASAVALSWYFRAKPRHDPAMRAARREARAVVWRLWHARYNGGLRGALNASEGDLLESAATIWSETRRMFAVAGWRDRSHGAYSAAMEHALTAMEGGMLRLLTLTGGGDRTAAACQAILKQMEDLAEEVEALTRSRLRSPTEHSHSDASIIAALEHLRQLRHAEEEIERIEQHQ
jgi:hypothetical protein